MRRRKAPSGPVRAPVFKNEAAAAAGPRIIILRKPSSCVTRTRAPATGWPFSSTVRPATLAAFLSAKLADPADWIPADTCCKEEVRYPSRPASMV